MVSKMNNPDHTAEIDLCPHGVPIPEECVACHKDDSLLEEWK